MTASKKANGMAIKKQVSKKTPAAKKKAAAKSSRQREGDTGNGSKTKKDSADLAGKKGKDQQKPPKKHARGRPPKFKPEYTELAYKFTLLGATDAEMASFFNVAESTIHKWKLDYPEFSESIKSGKLKADAAVAESLYKKATGFTAPEEKLLVVGRNVVRERINRFYPPDVFAQCVWLNNRRPNDWRKNKEPDGGEINKEPFQFNMLPPSDPDLAAAPEDLGDEHKGGRAGTDYEHLRGDDDDQ